MKPTIHFFLLLTILGYGCQAQEFEAPSITGHIKTLADDSFQGRGTGTAGEKAAADYVMAAFRKLGLQPKGDNGTYLQSFPFRGGAHGEGEAGTAANIVGYLDNKASTTVIIGAHYDHLGTDGQQSSLDANPQNKIHNGADDNASGVAGVIELARYFTSNGKKERNNFLFLCFSGEELGLLGSKYFADHAPVDLSTINYMINMDMIGRLDPQTKTVTVHGTGTSPVWEPLLKKLETDNLKIKTDSSGTGPSDHTSFYLKNLPVLHFFTGAHSDYHKPSDDWEKINAAGEVEVLKLIANIVNSLDKEPKLTFLKTKSRMQAGRSAFKVTLGIMPSYTGDVEGLKVDGVTEGRPGDKAGMKTGDVIIQLGDHPIKDIQQYMDALGKFEKGQTVPAKVKRDGKVLELEVIF
ncbi:M20/M25/M40 family metallo-hydrolase [Fulvivirgaceae bacterium PWU4]|uniref:M20/M25/M40 family metallo-hydrolase n=1 Tax=Chryseosolibacter histidini TaxID=2782349 RepID=A0AAP2DK06_9BACT|nr:M20/M25/M40 family metallo-hydrolase [Chryseosolibacter histidini]MBT1696778.1 M20/M25/M40 family metallo-hydrolase [Chryseosolibacter histidini]